jgi:hypothetical protein
MATHKLKRRRVTPEEAYSRMQAEDSAAKAFGNKRRYRGKKEAESQALHQWQMQALKVEPIIDQTLINTPAQVGVADIRRAIMAASKLQGTFETEISYFEKSQLPQEILENKSMEQNHNIEEQEKSVLNASAELNAMQMPIAPLGQINVNYEFAKVDEFEKEQKIEQIRSPLQITPIYEQKIELSKEASKQKKHAISRLIDWVMRAWRRIKAVLARMNGPRLTPAGKLALEQLKRLYELIALGFNPDEMEIVRLRVAFGEAYYHIMEASRRHSKRKRMDNAAEYQAYVERFLRKASAELEDGI